MRQISEIGFSCIRAFRQVLSRRKAGICRACSTAWRWKSSAHPDSGEGLAKRKGGAVRWGLAEAWGKPRLDGQDPDTKPTRPDEQAGLAGGDDGKFGKSEEAVQADQDQRDREFEHRPKRPARTARPGLSSVVTGSRT